MLPGKRKEFKENLGLLARRVQDGILQPVAKDGILLYRGFPIRKLSMI